MITYLVGDATDPQEVEQGTNDENRRWRVSTKIIAHICNDVGAWGAGFVMALSHRWPAAEKSYRSWHKMDGGPMKQSELVPFRLGRMKLVRVSNDVFVANMIAQRGIGMKNGEPPIRYSALADCLAELRLHAKDLRASVHMPRIGCGLAGGKWEEVEQVINLELHDIKVYVYDLHSSSSSPFRTT